MEARSATRHARWAVIVLGGLSLALTGAAAASADSELLPGAIGSAADGGVRALDLGRPLTLDIPAGDLTPGGTAATRQVIANTAAVPLRYAVASQSTDPDGKGLRNVVEVTITTCDELETPPLYAGTLGSRTAGFGDPRIGGHPGDRILAPGERASLCFAVTMPITAGNDYQGATLATTWTLSAEQVAGNP